VGTAVEGMGLMDGIGGNCFVVDVAADDEVDLVGPSLPSLGIRPGSGHIC
jgi:hypothetical protein